MIELTEQEATLLSIVAEAFSRDPDPNSLDRITEQLRGELDEAAWARLDGAVNQLKNALEASGGSADAAVAELLGSEDPLSQDAGRVFSWALGRMAAR